MYACKYSYLFRIFIPKEEILVFVDELFVGSPKSIGATNFVFNAFLLEYYLRGMA